MIPSLAASITAAMFFVTYFQPPLGRFAATPQGWVSTTSFVLASLLVSHLSARGRRSAAEAIQHSRESQLIEQFGRGLLACCGCQLVASTAVNEAVGLFGASAAAFEFVPEGRSHRSGPAGWEWSIPERLRHEALAHGEWVRDASLQTVVIPLVLEHTPVAYFGLRGATVSDTVLTAISRQLLMTRCVWMNEPGKIEFGIRP
jgi:K+-sensing histidine kinase KdpD